MSVGLTLFHAVQGAASVYAGLLSAMAIYNLQQREEQAEHAAQYSNTAADQLHGTRSTQTSGAIAVSNDRLNNVSARANHTCARSILIPTCYLWPDDILFHIVGNPCHHVIL